MTKVPQHPGGPSSTADANDKTRNLAREEIIYQGQLLADLGICQIDNFLPPQMLAECVELLIATKGEAYRKETRSTIYLTPPDEESAPDHPLRTTVYNRVGTLAADQLPSRFPLSSLYRSKRFVDLISAIAGRDLHFLADKLGSVNALIFNRGDELGWHYDEPNYSVTLLLQKSESGGEFEYIPLSLLPNKYDYARVGECLSMHKSYSNAARVSPGSLVIIRGNKLLHRVTQVTGTTPRLIAVLSFSERHDAVLTDYDRQLFYGRSS
ncbi:hypothetical protein NKH09_28365 [Mesorhizobium sp. M1339]|uniref:HalD/BesD family halogenase n=1 Tax=unclassified Mesorhizobium TaxID=325217 RepID=UPI00333DEFA7